MTRSSEAPSSLSARIRMTGDMTWRTTTDIITVRTASEVPGTGAGIIRHGTAGISLLGDIEDGMTDGTTEAGTTLTITEASTEDGTTLGTGEATGDGMTLGIILTIADGMVDGIRTGDIITITDTARAT